jgi:2-C-methyl-D-erythritol 4-phosphate cytidylyltransferase
MANDCGVIIVAAGKGERMGGEVPKQFRRLGDRLVFEWSVRFFADQPAVRQVALVVPAERVPKLRLALAAAGFGDRVLVVSGGMRRQDSVVSGLAALDRGCALVAVHDAARPFPPRNFETLCVEAREYGAALYAWPILDTVKRSDREGFAIETLDRSELWGAQTPQVFRRELLERALDHCNEAGIEVTDDAAAVALLGVAAKLVLGDRWNIKLTTPDDWIVAECLARMRSAPDAAPNAIPKPGQQRSA